MHAIFQKYAQAVAAHRTDLFVLMLSKCLYTKKFIEHSGCMALLVNYQSSISICHMSDVCAIAILTAILKAILTDLEVLH